MKYDANYFIQKFEAIPENQWCTGIYVHEGTRCALGHCGVLNEDDGEVVGEARGLCIVIESAFGPTVNVTAINDGEDHRFLQFTPKQRMLAALRDAAATEST